MYVGSSKPEGMAAYVVITLFLFHHVSMLSPAGTVEHCHPLMLSTGLGCIVESILGWLVGEAEIIWNSVEQNYFITLCCSAN